MQCIRMENMRLINCITKTTTTKHARRSFQPKTKVIVLPDRLKPCTFILRFMPFSSMAWALDRGVFLDDESSSEPGPAVGSTGSAVGRPILPRGLQNLTLGGEWNHRLDHVALPSGVRTLKFGDCFNKSLSNATLPSGLRVLTFGGKFNRALGNTTLPSGLRILTFGGKFNRNLGNWV